MKIKVTKNQILTTDRSVYTAWEPCTYGDEGCSHQTSTSERDEDGNVSYWGDVATRKQALSEYNHLPAGPERSRIVREWDKAQAERAIEFILKAFPEAADGTKDSGRIDKYHAGPNQTVFIPETNITNLGRKIIIAIGNELDGDRGETPDTQCWVEDVAKKLQVNCQTINGALGKLYEEGLVRKHDWGEYEGKASGEVQLWLSESGWTEFDAMQFDPPPFPELKKPVYNIKRVYEKGVVSWSETYAIEKTLRKLEKIQDRDKGSLFFVKESEADFTVRVQGSIVDIFEGKVTEGHSNYIVRIRGFGEDWTK